MRSALSSGLTMQVHFALSARRADPSSTTQPTLIALQCGSLITSMKNMAASPHRKNGRHFALITGCGLVGWHGVDANSLFAVAFDKDVYPTNPCESWVHEYSMRADGYVWVVSNETTGDSLAGIYADSEKDAILNYIKDYT